MPKLKPIAIVATTAGALALGFALWTAPVLAPPALAQSNDQVEILNRLNRLEADIQTLHRQLARGGAPVAAGAAAPASGAIAPTQAADFEIRLSQLERSVQEAVGKYEEAVFGVGQVRERLEKLSSDLEFRLSQLESRSGTEGGPPVLLGAWRSPRWINLAAQHCQGWIGSGIYSEWDDVAIGIDMYRKAGGNRVVLANIFTDLRPDPAPNPMAQRAKISLYCPPAEARDRLKRLADMGVNDALLVCPFDAPDQLAAMRDLWP